MPGLAAALILLAGQTTSHPLGAQVDSLFSHYGPSTPGVAVAVIRDGRIVFKKGYGLANLEHGLPITERTVFHVGSVSKQFTAFAIYLLEKQGKLSLEDDVRKYLPELPGFGTVIRVKHLLAHTSGLRDHLAILSLAGWRMDDVLTTSQALRMIERQKELNFLPGSRYLYCNSGYVLLAEIVQRVSGTTFANFTQQNIFRPLAMHDTQFVDDHEIVIKNRADSYEQDNGIAKRVNLNDAIPGPSNLVTTAEDLAKWVANFETPVVGGRELVRRFNEPSQLDNGERAVYYSRPGDVGYHAKGQVVRVYRGLDVLSHGGHTGGFRSTFWRFPKQRFAIALLSNDEHFPQLEKAEALIDLFLKDALGPKQSEPPATSTPKPLAAAPADLNGFTGRFHSDELDTAYTAKVEQGRLILTHLRHGDIPLTPAGANAFTGRIQFPVRVEFHRNNAGQVTELRVSNFGATSVRFDKR